MGRENGFRLSTYDGPSTEFMRADGAGRIAGQGQGDDADYDLHGGLFQWSNKCYYVYGMTIGRSLFCASKDPLNDTDRTSREPRATDPNDSYVWLCVLLEERYM